VMAKLYRDGQGEKAFTNMQRLWASPFGRTRRPPGLPEPLDYVTEASALITERLPGRPLLELGDVGEARLAETMQLLADLHACGVEPEIRRTWRGILRSLARKVRRVREVAPQAASHIEPVVAGLSGARVKDSELVCAHGDFSARNVLVTEQRLVLIDWDRLQQADPARDVTYFAVWPWREAVQSGRMPDRQSLPRALETYRRLRPSVHLHRQVPFHVAAALVRMCCSLVELWPEQVDLVPGLTKAALRELERSG
jgi:aminoglycoside phosphotransferase (APT) family kinase protein